MLDHLPSAELWWVFFPQHFQLFFPPIFIKICETQILCTVYIYNRLMPIQVEKKIDPREMDIGTGIYGSRETKTRWRFGTCILVSLDSKFMICLYFYCCIYSEKTIFFWTTNQYTTWLAQNLVKVVYLEYFLKLYRFLWLLIAFIANK